MLQPALGTQQSFRVDPSGVTWYLRAPPSELYGALWLEPYLPKLGRLRQGLYTLNTVCRSSLEGPLIQRVCKCEFCLNEK